MKLLIKENRIVANVIMNTQLIMIMDELEGQKRWLRDGRFSCLNSSHNFELLNKAFPGIQVEYEDEDKRDKNIVEREYKYFFKTMPKIWQKEALAKCLKADIFALFMVQGSGKTKVLIDKSGYDWCKGKIDAVLIITKKGVHRQWIDVEYRKHLGGKIPWFGYYWKKNNEIEIPDKLLKREHLCVYSINYDAIKTKAGFSAVENFLKFHRDRVVIICDESQDIRNINSQRSKAISKIKNYANQRIIATGTPIGKSLIDEWAQFKFLDPDIIGIHYVTSFKREYCIMGGFENREIVSYRNIEKFRRKVDPFTFYLGKESLNLPPKFTSEFTFNLSDKQKEMIDDLRKNSVIDGVLIDNPAVIANKMQQISSGFFIDENGNEISLFNDLLSNPRIDALLDVINSSHKEKIVIWCKFQFDVKILKSILGDKAVTYFGLDSDKEAEKNKKIFLDNDSGIRYFISTAKKGGTGLNLQGPSRHVINYSHTDNAIDYWQSQDRVHRIGTEEPVPYTFLIGISSQDRKIMRRTIKKEAIHKIATAEEFQKWVLNDDEIPLSEEEMMGPTNEELECLNHESF